MATELTTEEELKQYGLSICACGCGKYTSAVFAVGHDQKALWALYRLLFPGQALEDVVKRLGADR